MADIVYVVGLGPGDPQFLTAQAKTALENADVLCGYTVWIWYAPITRKKNIMPPV